MMAIYLQSIKQGYKGPLFVGLGLSILALLFGGLFNQFKDQLGSFVELIPKGMEAFIGDMASASTPEGWLALELFPLFVPVSLGILGIVLGAKMIGREEDSGTIELLLAGLNSRTSVLLQKLMALLTLLFIPACMLFVAILVGRWLFDFQPDITYVAAACLSGWLLGAAYSMVAFLVQATTASRAIALGVGTAVLGLTYTLTIISKLFDSWKWTETYSPFYYYNIPATLLEGIDLSRALVLVGLIVAGALIAVFGFYRRDIGS